MTPFVIAAIVGGGLVVFSLVAGGDHDGVDHDFTHHSDHEFSASLPLLSFRFWMFALSGFGIIGVLLSLLDAGSLFTRYLAAIIGGILSGGIVWFLFRALQRAEGVGRQVSESPVGRLATVVTALRPRETGKVQLDLNGVTLEYLARSTEEAELAPGRPVVIVALNGTIAEVVAFDANEVG